MKRFIRKKLKQMLLAAAGIDPRVLKERELIFKVARFVACEMVEGDYLEFGTYKGASFVNAYKHLKKQFLTRTAQDMGGENTREAKDKRAQIWQGMRFIAFDSFEGLPELSPEDLHSVDFKRGQYAFSEKNFIQNVIDQGVPPEKLITVKGYFDKTCIDETRNKLSITKASVVWLDADLYSSTRDVLKFLTPVLQDGTILVFDDWFSFKGNPTRGVQKAFYEWANDLTAKFLFTEYQRESWKRMSFIVSKIAST